VIPKQTSQPWDTGKRRWHLLCKGRWHANQNSQCEAWYQEV